MGYYLYLQIRFINDYCYISIIVTKATSSPVGGTVDPTSDTSAAVATSSATASSSTTASLAATTAAMASATAATTASVDPLSFQNIPPIESQEVISSLYQHFNQSEMSQLVEGSLLILTITTFLVISTSYWERNILFNFPFVLDGAWIDPAVAAAAAVAHHPGLSADPYHPEYGIARYVIC